MQNAVGYEKPIFLAQGSIDRILYEFEAVKEEYRIGITPIPFFTITINNKYRG